jgi:hypothetical protein
MLADVVRVSGVVLLLVVGCRDKAPPPAATQAPSPVVVADAAPAAVLVADAAIPAADAAVPVDDAAATALSPAALAAAVWPTAIESTMVETRRTIGEFEIDVAYPRFRTRPPEIADALNARLAPLVEPGLDPKAYQGRLDLHCAPRVVNRLAVIVECSRMLDARTLAEARAGTGGAPAGPEPHVLAVWLQPGLPAITLDELAPTANASAALASISATCAGQCTFARDHFVLDEQGDIRFVPTDYCSVECGSDGAPRIPFDERTSKHPWVVKLDAWIRKRLESGQSLVK